MSTTTGGLTTLGPKGGFLTTQSSEQLPQAQASVTWVKGNHTVKAGWDWRWELEPVASSTGTAGNYTFGANGTQQIALQGVAISSGSSGFQFASFPLGDVSNVTINAPANYRDQKTQTSGYAQDTWKVTRSLTLDYGLRYDYGTCLRERAGREAAFSVDVATPPGYGEYAFQLKDGIPSSIHPVWPIFTANAGTLPGTVGAGPAVLGPSAGRPPRQCQWSIGVQRELSRNTVVEASYVGNRVIWLNASGLSTLNKLSQPMLNQLGFQVGNAADSSLLRTTFANLTPAQKTVMASRGLGLPYAGFPTAQTVQQGILPFPQYTTLTPVAALGDSWFNALQLVVTQRLWHGLTLNANYSYSKTLSLTSSPDPFNRQLGKNLSNLDLPHQFRLSASYTVPTQRSGMFGNRILSSIVSGWSTGWFLQYQSAPILAPPATPTTNPISQWLGDGPGPAQMVPGQSLFSSNWTDYQGVVHTTPIDINCHCFNPQTTTVLNPNAWSAVPDAQFAANQSSIRYYRGFRAPMENVNFGRNFRIKEGITLQIRGDWTNAFNRLQLPQPTTTGYTTAPTKVNGIYTGGFGSIVPTAGNGISGMRSGQLIARITF